jgi:hypothetical protein
MKRTIGLSLCFAGLLVLLYKEIGFWGYGGYVDKTLENIIISLSLFILGVMMIRNLKPAKSKEVS